MFGHRPKGGKRKEQKMKNVTKMAFICLMLITFAAFASNDANKSNISMIDDSGLESSTLGDNEQGSSYTIIGNLKINPTSNEKDQFEMLTAFGLIDMDKLRSEGSSYTYRGTATEIKIKPHSGGQSIILNGWSVDLTTKKRYTITADLITVYLYNAYGEGSNEGHWVIEIEATEATIDPAPIVPQDDCISCVADDDPNAPRDDDYYSYVFEFENGESVRGTSEDKEAIVQVGIYEMKLKVDCSDEFKNGYGKKNDPSGDEGHPRVIFYQLWKYKIDAKKSTCKLDKECVGAPELVEVGEDGNKKILRIGPKAGVNDGVQFFNEDKKLVSEPKQLEQGDKIDIHVLVVNTTNQDAYLIGWFDANQNAEIEEKEVFLDKKVESTKNLEITLIEDSFKIPKEKKDDDDDDDELEIAVLQFDLLDAKFLLISKSQFKGINGDDQNIGSFRKEKDMMLQEHAKPGATIMTNTSDEEYYPANFSDETPVAVRLSAFDAMQTVTGIKLEWKVEQETNHAGYNIFRSENEDSGYEQVNSSIILGWDGFSAFNGTYEYVDEVFGAYHYKLEAVEMDGSTEIFGPYSVKSTTGVADKLDIPETFALQQNYPNPFNPSTTISFSLAERTNVSITIFDMGGRIVNTLVNGQKGAGAHNVTWQAVDSSGESLPTGVYFYTMKTANFTSTKTMTIIK
jgi:hypothetical protein